MRQKQGHCRCELQASAFEIQLCLDSSILILTFLPEFEAPDILLNKSSHWFYPHSHHFKCTFSPQHRVQGSSCRPRLESLSPGQILQNGIDLPFVQPDPSKFSEHFPALPSDHHRSKVRSANVLATVYNWGDQ